jgi:mediator of RNA polymerase II transcription subunit 8
MLATYMEGITDHLAKNAELMNKLAVYPSTNYPGRTQEGLLGMLVRKKLEPTVQALVDEAREIETKNPTAVSPQNEEFGDWAAGWIAKRVMEAVQLDMQDEFTQAERQVGVENVRTGLRRKLEMKPPKLSGGNDEESSEEEESEDEDMEEDGSVEFGMGSVTNNPNALLRTEDDILRFATNGATVAPAAPPSTINTVFSVGNSRK